MQPLIAIALVMMLLGGVLFLLKKRGVARFAVLPGRTRRMEVVERVPLGPQHALHLVRVGGRCVLIATAPGNCQILENAPESI